MLSSQKCNVTNHGFAQKQKQKQNKNNNNNKNSLKATLYWKKSAVW